MNIIKDLQTLEHIYDKPADRALSKVANELTPLYQQWIEASRFLILATTGNDRCDASPRGDRDDLVRIIDPQTLWLPDWRGNNRLDSLKNIVINGRVSLMFMANSCNNVVRVNGTAVLTDEESIIQQFERNGISPRTVIVVSVRETYFQCAKAIMRSGLWQAEKAQKPLPTAGDFFKGTGSKVRR